MTDRDKFVELYKSVGIDLEIHETHSGSFLELQEGDHKSFTGYSGFGSQIMFDKDGKFVEQSFWE